MPSKRHRAASRQAQLRRRKRSSKAAPQVFDAGPTEPRLPPSLEDPEVEAVSELTPVPARTSAAATPVRRSRQRVSTEPSVYTYLGGEVRQIGVIAAFIAVILAVLTVLLRG